MDDDLGTFPGRGAAPRIADDRLTDSRDRVLRGCCKLAFGVGTHLTNDLGPTQLSIVIKMVRCNGPPVAKRSDSPGKSMCDAPGYLTYLRQVCGLRANAAA